MDDFPFGVPLRNFQGTFVLHKIEGDFFSGDKSREKDWFWVGDTKMGALCGRSYDRQPSFVSVCMHELHKSGKGGKSVGHYCRVHSLTNQPEYNGMTACITRTIFSFDPIFCFVQDIGRPRRG